MSKLRTCFVPRRNRKTDKSMLKYIQDKRKFDSTYRSLLVGMSDSGKSTVVNQMRILYNPFTEEWKT